MPATADIREKLQHHRDLLLQQGHVAREGHPPQLDLLLHDQPRHQLAPAAVLLRAGTGTRVVPETWLYYSDLRIVAFRLPQLIGSSDLFFFFFNDVKVNSVRVRM